MNFTYQLQTKYQDSGWEVLSGEEFCRLQPAIRRARKLSGDAVAYGMIRVVRLSDGRIEAEFPAGGGLTVCVDINADDS